MRHALVAAMIAACGPATSPQPTTAPITGNHTTPQPDLRGRADQALRDEDRPDYQRPFSDKRVDHSRSTSLYVEACRGDDKAACWIAMAVANPDQWQAMALLVAANCKAGDAMSCRALPADDPPKIQFPSAPGAAGRSELCQSPDEGDKCDRAALRRECIEGFPASCKQLAMSRPTVADGGTLVARAVELAIIGCRNGIVTECPLVTLGGNDEQQTSASLRMCEVGRVNCESVGLAAMKRGDQTKAREGLERACQLEAEPETVCLRLAAAYLQHKLVEPVPGRGQALLDWACPRLAKILGKATFEQRVTECKGVAPK